MGVLAPVVDTLPGFRRRFVVTPGAGRVRAEVEDDYHCMAVAIDHADGIAVAINPDLQRAPWTTCPGAEAKLRETFTGVALADFGGRGEKTFNCTHLHDLATLAAAHAGDAGPTVYDVLVSDPVDGESFAELRVGGMVHFAWRLAGFTILDPPSLAGKSIDRLRGLIETLAPEEQEAVRIFRWAIMIASGRGIPLAQQSDARTMPANCFTFQPDTAIRAQRIGVIRDFSAGAGTPLDGWSATARAAHSQVSKVEGEDA